MSVSFLRTSGRDTFDHAPSSSSRMTDIRTSTYVGRATKKMNRIFSLLFSLAEKQEDHSNECVNETVVCNRYREKRDVES